MFNRIKNKIKNIKAKRNVSKGRGHNEGCDRLTIQEYWREKSNNTANDPETYIRAENNRAEYLYNLIKNLDLKSTDPILEIGMSSGKVLSHIYVRDYHNLTGIEINPKAIDFMKKEFPKVWKSSTIINASLEDSLPNLADNEFSLVYSMIVLAMVHPESNFILDHIARISKKYIITIEAENTVTKRHYPRDYKKIFEKRGFKQIFFEMTESKIKNYPNYHCRIFEKNITN